MKNTETFLKLFEKYKTQNILQFKKLCFERDTNHNDWTIAC